MSGTIETCAEKERVRMPDITVSPDAPDHAVGAIVEREPRRFVAVACRVPGTTGDVEDVLQESWLRWQLLEAPDRDAIRSPPENCRQIDRRARRRLEDAGRIHGIRIGVDADRLREVVH